VRVIYTQFEVQKISISITSCSGCDNYKEDVNMYWEWEKRSVLNEITNNTIPKDIYMALCKELARYYGEKGFKYTKSQPKLTFKTDDIQLEIGFKSSSYNKAGEYVCFEIIPTFYYIPFMKKDMKGRGILVNHMDISSEYDINKDDIKCELIGIYGDKQTFVNNAYPNEKVRYSHMCNVHNINSEKFLKIISYINNRIIPWIHKIQVVHGVEEIIAIKRAQRPDWNLQNSNDYINCSFAYYIYDRFPTLIEKWNIDPLNTQMK